MRALSFLLFLPYLTACKGSDGSAGGVSLHHDILGKDHRVATFWGKDAHNDCEQYRRVYASYCIWDATMWPRCEGINAETLATTSCR